MEKSLAPDNTANQPILVAFYAYSPIAGGFLAKTPEQLKNGKGRWDPESFLGKFYHGLYVQRPAVLGALDTWNKIAAAEGIPASELAFRWVFHNSILDGSKGDAVIVGASSLKQLRETVAAIRKGPLSPAVQEQIQGVWESMKHEAFLDNVSGQSDEFKKNLGDYVRQK
jgi:aryl-alcohol dehydrogenase-like predicted oxidoreductase